MMSTEKPSRSKIWRKRVIYLLLFVALIAGIRAWQQRDMVIGAAPPLHGALLDGSVYALPAKPTQPVLVYFWATWCPVCRAGQNSSVAAIARDHSDVITVAMQSGSVPEVAQYLAAQGLRFPVLNDPDGRLSAAWGVHAVPTSFIIGPDGEIRYVEVGYTTGLGLRLRLWLAGVLD